MGCGGSKPPEDVSYNTSADTKTAPARANPAPMVAPEPPSMPDAAAVLGPQRLARVKSIFTTWDMDGTGKIEISAFKGTTVKAGPVESKVLDQLSVMDYNDDGYVVAEEWEQYFALTCESLSDDEFELLMADIAEAASNMVAIISMVRLAQGPTPTGESGEGEEEAAPEPMSADRVAAVKELFAAWDPAGKGSIPLDKVQAGKMEVGPTQVQVFEALEMMDADGDKEVTLSEMLAYFTVLSEMMTDDQFFDTVRGDMLTLAQDTSLIAQLTALAGTAPTTTAADKPTTTAVEESAEAEEAEVETAGADEEEAPPPMSAMREELVKDLFTLFSSALDPIPLAELEADCTIEVGPARANLLKELHTMDANDDGKLTFDEMKDYFTLVGSSLTDDEFSTILTEMTDSAATASMLKVAAQ